MDVREKLVELLREVQYLGGLEEKIADHLIAHGVTVQDNTEISDELLEQLRNAPVMVMTEEPTVEVVQEWISVKDRLPGAGKIVMVYDREKGIYFSHRLYTHLSGKPFAIEYSGGWRVTHWMPLPQPPKGE